MQLKAILSYLYKKTDITITVSGKQTLMVIRTTVKMFKAEIQLNIKSLLKQVCLYHLLGQSDISNPHVGVSEGIFPNGHLNCLK